MDVPSAVTELLESVEKHLRARVAELLRDTRALLDSVEARLAQLEGKRKRGEDFNVFEALQLERGEEKLHSRFLAALLDPKGSHGQGPEFLRCFLQKIGDLVWKDEPKEPLAATKWINTGEARVKYEHWIGPNRIDGEDSEGGQIDVFITDDRHHLSIENKTRSSEGEEQVTRYCNYQRDRNFVLFLTPHGERAQRKMPNYAPISYRDHILPWLAACQQHAANMNIPIVQETIRQYIITVRGLTGGLTMDSQIRYAMEQHPKAALAIRNTLDGVIFDKVRELVETVKERIVENSAGRGWTVEIEPLDEKYKGLYVTHRCWGDTQVKWEGNPYMVQESSVGIRCHKDLSVRGRWDSDTEFRTRFPGIWKGSADDEYWPQWRLLERAGFSSEEGIERLFDKDWRSKFVDELVKELMTLAEYCEEKFRSGRPN